MTREEAIKLLKQTEANIKYDKNRDEIYFTHEWVGAYEMAIAALREQDNRLESDTAKVVDSDQFKTNADHIRSMTDEELAKFLRDSFWGRKQNARLFALKEWLKQPYKEAPHD